MIARARTSLCLFLALFVLTSGCELEPMSVDQDLAPAGLVVPVGAVGEVTVCKDGPPDIYSFGITTQLDLVNLPYGNTFTLGLDFLCKTVATTDAANRFVDVVEFASPSGTEFWKVEVYNYGVLSAGGQELKYTSFANTPLTIGPFGGDNGWVVVYYNRPVQSPGCTLTQGYWKNHEDAWPTSSLMLGNVAYTKAQLLAILGQPVKGNGLVSISHQLIAAKLNVLAGADGSTIAAAIAQADAMIGGLVVPPVGDGSLATNVTSSLTTMLDNFNRGLTGPGHCGGTVD